MSDSPLLRSQAGYRSRPATTADVREIHRLVTACEHRLHDGATTDADGIAADLGQPGLDLPYDTVLVHDDGGQLAGWAWVRGRRSTVDVHPDHRGRGLGRSLLDWAEARARRRGGDRLAQTVSDSDRTAVALLRSSGYSPLVTEWLLEIAMPEEPVVPEPPEGVVVRPFRPGDGHAVHRLTEDAFDEWQQRRQSYQEWARHTVDRTTFEPAASPIAFAGDRMVGAVLSLNGPGRDEGYVERVAVRHDHRNRGIARMLLREAFRAFYVRGMRTCTLWTHSDTGALSLYERIGMTVRRSSTVYSKDLAPGRAGDGVDDSPFPQAPSE
ncbi:GNAT family N-acetyltransferase [Streptomyces sp. ID05-04B]|uniref:GNAT family N-acetyltransferase n=1 Tax=unclassified Streptomyces TaxID=2593676 RepID=UPI000D1B87CA|nr:MULTISPECIES: GNAT family N-acetyltransferase [unclassified Streptomyces]AVV44566.1 GNAT family N-acetyltransferase [Streptomyces sp. P3]MDX5564770.1 GNAT family N-acetyltransferase [Streptomyces sp. ID05-04B]